MATIVHDQYTEEQLRARRVVTGADRWDEVWEGVYVMNPLPNNEHQELSMDLGAVLREVIALPKLGRVFSGVNVSDRKDHWEHNYRCPDIAVYRNDSLSEDCGTFWFGGPDLAVEIVTPDDTVREKVEFYAKVNTRELLIIDRQPWQLELLRLIDHKLKPVGSRSLANQEWIECETVPLKMRLLSDGAQDRPEIEFVYRETEQSWRI